MSNEPTNDQSKRMLETLAQAVELTPEQLNVLGHMLPLLQPWQADLIRVLLDGRMADKQALRMAEVMQSARFGLGNKVQHPSVSGEKRMPKGYRAEPVLGIDGNQVFALAYDSEPVQLVGHAVYDEAGIIEAAYRHDKLADPHRWRPVSELCPANEPLIFACADWAHSVQLNKDVPVKMGYRDEKAYHLFGGSWKPTHWSYPVAPEMERNGQAAHQPASQAELLRNAAKAKIAYDAAMKSLNQSFEGETELGLSAREYVESEVAGFAFLDCDGENPLAIVERIKGTLPGLV